MLMKEWTLLAQKKPLFLLYPWAACLLFLGVIKRSQPRNEVITALKVQEKTWIEYVFCVYIMEVQMTNMTRK